MRESPIPFSAPMVRAILDGRKTVTRRIVKPQPIMRSGDDCVIEYGKQRHTGPASYLIGEILPKFGCPYGEPGDRLWVKETHRPSIAHSHGAGDCDCADVCVQYQADGEIRFYSDGYIDEHSSGWCIPKAAQRGNFVPSIHMPRWASRITLEVTDVRVERLQEGEGEMCRDSRYLAEGINRIHHGDGAYYYSAFRNESHPKNWNDPFYAWRELWQSTGGDWDANAWVWAVSFRRIEQEARAA